MAKITLDFSQFKPGLYLREYYNHVGRENREILNFLHRAYLNIFSQISNASVLELGGGPTVYQLISLAKYSVSINFTDFSASNLTEIQKWINAQSDAFPWKKFIRYVLKAEGVSGSSKNIARRENSIRAKIKKIFQLDIRHLPEKRKQYDLISSHFMAESITDNHNEWKSALQNLTAFIKPGGYLISSIILSASLYHVGRRRFSAVPIQESEVIFQLTNLNLSILDTHFVQAESNQGYSGIFMVLAKKI
ncbi:methyltransferase domain-containing protein [Candidatus Amesbacteria bacterium]|nr:methyltransferase domain-containing protein [Candidatus Amesbacteria bacterium]